MSYRKEVKKVHVAVDSLKNKVGVYADISKLKNRSLRSPLKDLVHSSAPGKKVTKIGIALFWLPEPTMVSDFIALPMIAAGKIIDRYYTGATIKHVGEEAARTMKSLKEFLS